MSGAPVGSFFSVTMNGAEKRYTIGTNVLSERVLSRLRTLVIHRRREIRKQLMEDFGKFGRELPKSAQEAFSANLLADAKADLDVGLDAGLKLLETLDREAVAEILECAVDEIGSHEEALEVLEAYGDTADLIGKVMEVAQSVDHSVKNSPRRPGKASAK